MTFHMNSTVNLEYELNRSTQAKLLSLSDEVSMDVVHFNNILVHFVLIRYSRLLMFLHSVALQRCSL